MNNLSLAFKISEFDYEIDYINNILNVAPTRSFKKGDTYFIGPQHNREARIHENNYWEYGVFIRNNAVWIKVIIDQFIEEIIIRKENELYQIKDNCRMELFIGVNFKKNASLDSFHFGTSLIQVFSRLNIEIDIDQFIFDDLN